MNWGKIARVGLKVIVAAPLLLDLAKTSVKAGKVIVAAKSEPVK